MGTKLRPIDGQQVTFAWLEITGKCQLECGHCYAESGPSGTHGVMEATDWRRVIAELAATGVSMVQFIGGEPSLHPDLPELVDYALECKLEVEVFSNLTHIRPELWETFSRPGVRLATSYYSSKVSEHEQITKKRGSHRRTTANIVEALKRSIPLRVGLINVINDQHYEEAREQLVALGVDKYAIGIDNLRGVGRGVSPGKEGLSQLCGNCACAVIAISPNGEVWPCVFSRWMSIGNVQDSSVGSILKGEACASTRELLLGEFASREGSCAPWPCRPEDVCKPTDNKSVEPDEITAERCDPLVTCYPACGPSCRPGALCEPVTGNHEVDAKCGPDVCAPDANCNPTTCMPICEPSPRCIPKACQPHGKKYVDASSNQGPHEHYRVDAACAPEERRDPCGPDCQPRCKPVYDNHPDLCRPKDQRKHHEEACQPTCAPPCAPACGPTSCVPCVPGAKLEYATVPVRAEVPCGPCGPCHPTGCSPTCAPNSGCNPCAP